MNVKKQVLEIIKEYSSQEVELNDLKPTSDLKDIFGIDSIDIVDIVVDIENHFKINLDDERINNIVTYEQLIKAIETELN